MIPPSLSTSSLLTCTPVFFSTRPSTGPLQIYHCDDPVNVSFGSLADLHSPTGYENKDPTEESNSALVKPMFFHRPSMTFTSLPLCKRKPDAKFISGSEDYGKPVALLSSRRKSSQETFSDREAFSSEHQQILGNNEPQFQFSNRENFDEIISRRTHTLHARRSKI